MEEKVLKTLKRFVGKSEMRPQFNTPFEHKGYVYATDTYTGIRTAGCTLEDADPVPRGDIKEELQRLLSNTTCFIGEVNVKSELKRLREMFGTPKKRTPEHIHIYGMAIKWEYIYKVLLSLKGEVKVYESTPNSILFKDDTFDIVVMKWMSTDPSRYESMVIQTN